MKSTARFSWLGIVLALVAAAAAVVMIDADGIGRWLPHAKKSTATADNPVAPAEPIRIGVVVGITGANSVVAPGVLQSAQLAVDEINAAGGILQRHVVLEVADDATSAEGAQRAIDQLAPRVSAIVAMETSAARNAALPLVTRSKLPYIYTSFYEGRSCNPWMYVNGWVPEQQVEPLVDYMTKERGARSFFLVGSDYAFGRGILEFATKKIQQAGGQIVGEEYLPVDGGDWSAAIAKIKAARPDALITATAGGAPNVSLTKQLKLANLKLLYGNLSIDESTAKSLGALATGMLFSASYLTGIESPENSAFLGRMMMKFGAQLQAPNELSVPQYEAIHLYKAAVEKAGSTESGKVIAALKEVTFHGPRGDVRMDRSRHAALTMRLARMRSDGSIAILKTFPGVDPGVQCADMQ